MCVMIIYIGAFKEIEELLAIQVRNVSFKKYYDLFMFCLLFVLIVYIFNLINYNELRVSTSAMICCFLVIC